MNTNSELWNSFLAIIEQEWPEKYAHVVDVKTFPGFAQVTNNKKELAKAIYSDIIICLEAKEALPKKITAEEYFYTVLQTGILPQARTAKRFIQAYVTIKQTQLLPVAPALAAPMINPEGLRPPENESVYAPLSTNWFARLSVLNTGTYKWAVRGVLLIGVALGFWYYKRYYFSETEKVELDTLIRDAAKAQFTYFIKGDTTQQMLLILTILAPVRPALRFTRK